MARTTETGTAERRSSTWPRRSCNQRGFNGFSYADVAEELGITKAALHYHFPGKAELGEALDRRGTRPGSRTRWSRSTGTSPTRPAKLRAYAQLYADVFQDDRMCLCGMLAADYATLPDPMRERVVRFFDDNERWLARVLEAGRSRRDAPVPRARRAASRARSSAASRARCWSPGPTATSSGSAPRRPC